MVHVFFVSFLRNLCLFQIYSEYILIYFFLEVLSLAFMLGLWSSLVNCCLQCEISTEVHIFCTNAIVLAILLSVKEFPFPLNLFLMNWLKIVLIYVWSVSGHYSVLLLYTVSSHFTVSNNVALTLEMKLCTFLFFCFVCSALFFFS